MADSTAVIADQVKRLRVERGWSARQLAEECVRAGAPSLTRATIAKIESRVRKSVTAHELATLARVLGVRPTDLSSPTDDAGDVTVGILTALPVAAAAVSAVMEDVETVEMDSGPNLYHVGYLPSSDPGRRHRVAATTVARNAAGDLAAVCNDLVLSFPRVRCVVVVGVAAVGPAAVGGTERPTRLGDVVLANKLVELPARAPAGRSRGAARTIGGLSKELHEAAAYLADAEQGGLVDQEFRRPLAVRTGQAGAFARPAAADPPTIHHGALASVGQLARDDWPGELATEPDVIAVDTVSATAAMSAWQRGVGWFVVDGVADYGPESKVGDRWQAYAAMTAAVCLRALLSVCSPSAAEAAPTPVKGRRGATGELRQALITELLDLPFIGALSDRRLLVNLMSRDAADFRGAVERSEPRLHVVEIVIACMETRGGLRALASALEVMAPEQAATRRVRQLVERASLESLLPEAEVTAAADLLRRLADAVPRATWIGLSDQLSATGVGEADDVVDVYRQLVALAPDQSGTPPAVRLVSHVAKQTTGPIATELEHWVDRVVRYLDLPDDAVPQTQSAVESLIGESELVLEPSYADSDAMSAQIDLRPRATTTSPAGRRELPQVWGDVPARNPSFTGRLDLLEALHDSLTGQVTAVLPNALHGMGGVGKTQLAIEYIHRHSGEYDLVWWIPAEQHGQILASLTALAQRLRLDVSPEANSSVPAVREALSTGATPYDRWLLVFDNAEDVGDVRAFFPTGGTGKILVTARNPEWALVAHALEVDVFTRAESVQFLTARTPVLSASDADRLAEALGDLPLAVEQAAAWMAVTGMPVDEYLALLDHKRMELLDAEPSPNYERSVAAAWEMALERLASINQAALDLLQICAFFAPQPIPRELFVGAPSVPITDELDAALADPFRLGRALRDIQRYALAKMDHRRGTLQIHRLVQAVVVGRMDLQRRALMRRGAHVLLANGNPGSPSRPERWTRYQALLPHVIVSRAVESTEAPVRELVFGMAEFLYHWGDYEGCESLVSDAYRHRLDDLGEADPYTLRLATYLGFIRRVMGRYRDAAELSRRTLDLYEDTLGAEDEGTLDAKSTLVAADLRIRGEFAEAREIDEQVLAVSRRAFGEDDPATLKFAYSLASSLRLMGDFRQAAMLDEDTYRRQSEVLGAEAEPTLLTLDALATDKRECGDYLGARMLQQEAYRRCVEEFGADNPAALRTARNLAVAHRAAGDHQTAYRLAKETLERFYRRYGDDHPDTMVAALSFSVDLRCAGELEAARSLTDATVERFRRSFGERHPYTLAARVNLAVVQRLEGELSEAREANQATLDALSARLGPDHPMTLACAVNLASDRFALDEIQSAYEQDTDTLIRLERVWGIEHPSTLACAVNLSLDLRALGRVSEGDKILSDAMVRYRRVLGERHIATLNALQAIRANREIDLPSI
ncbi:FxSxx-COOH system tetratricopeptide repeat protein [Actinoplanes aureus]|uniref:Tetratricopeptide repeat protein n=1 Tax=Actinoplanes aureus TaxID=2792083 RepID=A0A931C3X9_9ACTN|nr:FxSxx-COOH system tetratricopeptide repeat protein [Actinoplanes aureus]MBG0560122.1 tetratricopeptide repeat protein [Actinoplanes aureus]